MIEDKELVEKFDSLWALSLRDAAESGHGAEPDKWLAMRYFKFGYEAKMEKEVKEVEGQVMIETVRPYEEDFKKAQAELEESVKRLGGYYNAKITGEQVREFFFVKGRESAKVAVDLEDGKIRTNAGVQVGVMDEYIYYNHTDSNKDVTEDYCEDDDCSHEEMTIEERLKRVGFEGLKKVEDAVEF